MERSGSCGEQVPRRQTRRRRESYMPAAVLWRRAAALWLQAAVLWLQVAVLRIQAAAPWLGAAALRLQVAVMGRTAAVQLLHRAQAMAVCFAACFEHWHA